MPKSGGGKGGGSGKPKGQQAGLSLPGLPKYTPKSYTKLINDFVKTNPSILFPPGQELINAKLLRIHGNSKKSNNIENLRNVNLLSGNDRKIINDKIENGTATKADVDKLGLADLGPSDTNYAKAIEDDPRFKALGIHYNNVSPLQQQLTGATARSLINVPSTGRKLAPTSGKLQGKAIHYGNLEGIDLYTHPIPDSSSKAGGTADFYDFEEDSPTEQQILLSTKKQSISPIIALIHEGRHAIDDLFKRPHQREMINFLAEQEKLKPSKPKPSTASRKTWFEPLIDKAQEVIVDPAFKNNHNYGFFEENVDNSLSNLSVSKNKTAPQNPGNFGFQKAKQALDKIRADRTKGDPGDAFRGLSEFNAYMMEQLGENWKNPNSNNNAFNPNNDAARRFMKENLRTSYRDYNELTGGNLATNFPEVHQKFFDRYNDLRNPKRVESTSNDPVRRAEALLKMGANYTPQGLGNYLSSQDAAAAGVIPDINPPPGPVAKPILNAIDPISGNPNVFPPPKYTNRAKGGRVTGKNLLARFIKPKRKAS